MSEVRLARLEVGEPQRSAVLSRAGDQLRSWGHPQPSGETLVLDFGLGRFNEVGLVEFWVANEVAAGYCGKYMLCSAGQACPRHQHRTKHETFFVVQGRVEITLGTRQVTLRQGQTLAVPPGCTHGFRGLETSLLLELSMPCDVTDNYFEDPQIDAWLRAATAREPG